jgi:hypothetical protein
MGKGNGSTLLFRRNVIKVFKASFHTLSLIWDNTFKNTYHGNYNKTSEDPNRIYSGIDNVNFMATYDMLVVFSGSSGFLHQ